MYDFNFLLEQDIETDGGKAVFNMIDEISSTLLALDTNGLVRSDAVELATNFSEWTTALAVGQIGQFDEDIFGSYQELMSLCSDIIHLLIVVNGHCKNNTYRQRNIFNPDGVERTDKIKYFIHTVIVNDINYQIESTIRWMGLTMTNSRTVTITDTPEGEAVRLSDFITALSNSTGKYRRSPH